MSKRTEGKLVFDSGGGDDPVIKVFIVAASAIVRTGLAALVAADERFVVVGSKEGRGAAGHTESLHIIEAAPDVVLLEFDSERDAELVESLMPDATEISPPAFIALVDLSQSESFNNLLGAGVRGVLPHSASGAEIIAALQAVAAGLVVLPADAAEAILQTRDSSLEEQIPGNSTPYLNPANLLNNTSESFIEPLTRREREVLVMLAEGLSNKDIASRLTISEHTVKFHVSAILAKLEVSTRTEAVTRGLRQGLIML